MHIDTREYMVIRGELAGLGDAVEELARRQRDETARLDLELSHARGQVCVLAEAVEEAVLVLTSPRPAPAASCKPRLAQVISFPESDR